jgi:hypothetical protein
LLSFSDSEEENFLSNEHSNSLFRLDFRTDSGETLIQNGCLEKRIFFRKATFKY